MLVFTFYRQGASTSKKILKIALGSQPCGLVRLDKEIVVGCMDNTLSTYNSKVISISHFLRWRCM